MKNLMKLRRKLRKWTRVLIYFIITDKYVFLFYLEDQERFKNHQLPLARVKKIMKSDEDVRVKIIIINNIF